MMAKCFDEAHLGPLSQKRQGGKKRKRKKKQTKKITKSNCPMCPWRAIGLILPKGPVALDTPNCQLGLSLLIISWTQQGDRTLRNIAAHLRRVLFTSPLICVRKSTRWVNGLKGKTIMNKIGGSRVWSGWDIYAAVCCRMIWWPLALVGLDLNVYFVVTFVLWSHSRKPWEQQRAKW